MRALMVGLLVLAGCAPTPCERICAWQYDRCHPELEESPDGCVTVCGRIEASGEEVIATPEGCATCLEQAGCDAGFDECRPRACGQYFPIY